jgi:WD40 repeat protein
LREFFLDYRALERAAPHLPAATSDGSSAVSLPRPFGDFELIEEIGRGGMGIVFKARQRTLGRTVAVKMILAGQMASSPDIDRFYAEAHAAATLDHPHIVPIFDVGQHDGQHYFAMGFVEGESLAQRIFRGPLSAPEAATIIQQVALAVHYAHGQGVIHRDLKPANILLDASGRARVTDFGLAKCDSDAPGITCAGQVLGTLNFMPPEQITGASADLGPASDVYALGATLYAVVTGRPPFQAASALDTMKLVIERDPVRPRELNPGIPRDLETIALKCLEKSPLRRYVSAQALADDLARFRSIRPILARRSTLAERFVRWCRRNPLVAGLTCAVAALLISVSLITMTFSVQLANQLTRTRSAQDAQRAANVQALERLWESYVAEADARRTSGRVGQRFLGLEALDNANQLATSISLDEGQIDRMRSAAIGCLALPDLQTVREWQDAATGDGYATLGLGKSLYARWIGRGEVVVRKLGNGQLVSRFTEIPVESRLVLSPDDTMLAIVHDECRVFQLDMTSPRLCFQSSGQGWWSFSPDSRGIMGAVKDGTLTLFDLRTGKVLRTFGEAIAETPIVFSPDAKSAALITSGVIRILDFETGQSRAQFEAPSVTPFSHCLAWHPRGDILAAGVYPKDGVVLWDVSSGAKLQSLPHPLCELRLCFNSFGDQLFVQSLWDQLATVWNVDSDRAELTITGVGMAGLRADDNGNFAILSIKDADSYSEQIIQQSQVYRTLARPRVRSDWAFNDVAFRQDGRLAAVASYGVIQLYRLPDWTLIREIVTGSRFVAFDSRGAMLTCTQQGLSKWPAAAGKPSAPLPAGEGPDAIFCPPAQLLPVTAYTSFAISRDGTLVAVPNGDGALLWRADDPEHPRPFGPHSDVRSVSLNADRQLLATGGWEAGYAKVWDLATGELIMNLDSGKYCAVHFSPHGKWLATAAEKLCLWNVETWQKMLETQAGSNVMCFAPDSRTLAVTDTHGQIRLIDPKTGKTLTTLAHPNGAPTAGTIAFSSDGRFLATPSRFGREAAQVWDLITLRQELRSRGLDWSDSRGR